MDARYKDWLQWWQRTGRADLEGILFRGLDPGAGDDTQRRDVCAGYATRIGMRLRRGISNEGIADLLVAAHDELGVRVRRRNVGATAMEIRIWYSAQRCDSPHLFDALGAELGAGRREASVPVPAGVVRWGFGVPSRTIADRAWPGRDATIFAWSSDDFLVELRVERRLPELPPGMEIVDGWIGHWRLRCHRTATPPALSCSLSDVPDDVRGEDATAEHLDAQTYEFAGHRISIGTFAADGLAARAGRTVPARWQRQLIDSMYGNAPQPVRYDRDGLTLSLPELRTNETCEVHHAVAWQQARTSSKYASWNAVDQMGAPSDERWPPPGESAWRS